MSLAYTEVGWTDNSVPALDAANLNIMDNQIAALSGTLQVTSGALGALAVVVDTTYILTAASTATLPTNAVAVSGQKITFKAKTNATSTISAAAGQTIGTTSSTSFILYAQEDYVTLQYDGTSIWYVMATNGPVLSSAQTAQTSCNSAGTWTAIGNGLTLGTLAPGIYDLDMSLSIQVPPYGYLYISIGNSTTPISSISYASISTGSLLLISSISVFTRGYILGASATIQGIYYSTSTNQYIAYGSPGSIGKITARRIA
jgi:hypothetical protein